MGIRMGQAGRQAGRGTGSLRERWRGMTFATKRVYACMETEPGGIHGYAHGSVVKNMEGHARSLPPLEGIEIWLPVLAAS